ncbi:MAG: hypothetical protein AAF692_09845, partial [Pseudomonadota bacterium]
MIGQNGAQGARVDAEAFSQALAVADGLPSEASQPTLTALTGENAGSEDRVDAPFGPSLEPTGYAYPLKGRLSPKDVSEERQPQISNGKEMPVAGTVLPHEGSKPAPPTPSTPATLVATSGGLSV